MSGNRSPSRKLFVVRQRLFGQNTSPPYGDGRMEGAFTTWQEAEVFREERERQWWRAGDLEPLDWMNGLEELFDLTDFDPPVFLDWLEDAGILPPPEVRWVGVEDVFEQWLRGLSEGQRERLYEGLHHFHSREVVEIDLVEGSYLPEDWEDWEAQAEHLRMHPDQAPGPPEADPASLLDDDIPF
jgi:hypothetical protein